MPEVGGLGLIFTENYITFLYMTCLNMHVCMHMSMCVCVKFLSNKQFGIINKSDYQRSFVSGNLVSLPLRGQCKDKSW